MGVKLTLDVVRLYAAEQPSLVLLGFGPWHCLAQRPPKLPTRHFQFSCYVLHCDHTADYDSALKV